MKTTRKILTLVLVAVLTLALAIPAFAGTADGSITVSNATIDKDYSIYKVFDATVDGSNVAYTIDDDSVWYTTISTATSVFKLTEIADNSGVKTYSVEVKSGVSDSEVLATFLTANGSFYEVTIPTGATAVDTKKAESATVAFSSLEYGYYLVTSTLGAFVSVDTTMPNVKILDKNQKPSWDNDTDPTDSNPGNGKVIIETENCCGLEPHTHDSTCYESDGTTLKCGKDEHAHSDNCKKTTENSANFGDTVNFDIGINATNFDGNQIITYYYITDTLDAGFTLDTTSIVVKVDGTTVTPLRSKYDAVNGTIAIVLDWAELNTSNELVPKYTKSFNEIHVTYSATVNNNATLGATPNKNIADYNYDVYDDPNTTGEDPYDPENPPKPDDGDPTDPQPKLPEPPHDPTDDDDTNDPESNDPKETDTYVYALGLKKTDDTNSPLPGATFKLKDTTIKLYRISAGLYRYDATSGTADQVLDCDSDGYLVIKGLEEGTYVLNEYDAPAGYNKCNDDITFTLAKGTDVETLKGVAITDSIPFENKSGTELPATGGIGTTLFITFGMIAMLAAGVFLVTNKRISKEAI